MNQNEQIRVRRQRLLEELAQLEQIRRGTVVEQFVERVCEDGTRVRKGPYVLYSFKEKGKTVSRRLPKKGEAKIYRKQIAAFRRFQEVTAELLKLGEQLSDLALCSEKDAQKNFALEVDLAKDREVSWVLERALGAAGFDLEAVETALRAAVLSAGGRLPGKLLEGVGSGRRDEPVICKCGGRMESRGLRSKELSTILGKVSWRHSMFQCPRCGAARYPGDEELDVQDTGYSPALRRMMARMGGKSTFKEASEDLRICAEVKVTAKAVERVAEAVGQDMEQWSRREHEQAVRRYAEQAQPTEKTIPTFYVQTDGTGVPMTRHELSGRRGKQPDGSARTREVKLGCVFTQTSLDKEGRPVRDPDSTTFVGKIEPAEQFGEQLFAEAVRRGLDQAHRVVVLGDAATWIKNIAETHFPGATQILDLYHAREHVDALAKALYPDNNKKVSRYRDQWWQQLDQGNIGAILAQARRRLKTRPELSDNAQGKINFLDNHKERMRYAHFREQGLFVGSGVIEAACGSVIGQRLKQSGMEWSLRGANAIISLRCTLKSGRADDYWEERAA